MGPGCELCDCLVAGLVNGSHGSLLLQGGVGDNREVDSAFRDLAGGSGAHIVVIPTAGIADAGPPGMESFLVNRNKAKFGVRTVSVIHSLDRATSNSEVFIEPLRRATGVWILGGFPERRPCSCSGSANGQRVRRQRRREPRDSPARRPLRSGCPDTQMSTTRRCTGQAGGPMR